MKIEKVEYFGGLFKEPDSAAASDADTHVVFEAAEVPQDVQQSFANERIEELRGEFGLPGAGKPEQVDYLEVTAGGKTLQIRVLNRGIALIFQDDEEISRLHRFFCVLTDTVRKTSD
ncbi:MAG: hypothetical protein WBF13_00070 [Candidatus Zixiibacteriota bacterium]